MRADRYFHPAINAGLLILVGLGILGAGVKHVSALHEARRAREAICQLRVDVVVARNPLLTKGWLMSPDACRNLAGLVGETGR